MISPFKAPSAMVQPRRNFESLLSYLLSRHLSEGLLVIRHNHKSNSFFKEVPSMSDAPTATWNAYCELCVSISEDQIKATEDIFDICAESSVPRTRLTSAGLKETTSVSIKLACWNDSLTNPWICNRKLCNHARCCAKGLSDSCHIDAFFKTWEMIQNEGWGDR